MDTTTAPVDEPSSPAPASQEGGHRPPQTPPSSPSTGDEVELSYALADTTAGEMDAGTLRLRTEVERLRGAQGRRAEQLRRLMAELKAARASRVAAESAFEQLNEAVAGLRRDEERRADLAVAECERARADLDTQRAATAAAEARADLEAQRADRVERQLADALAQAARLGEERLVEAGKLAEEQQRADRVLIHNLQLASRVRQLEQDLLDAGGGRTTTTTNNSSDLETGGADGAGGRGFSEGAMQAWVVWNERDRKGMMILIVLSLLLFWYLSYGRA